MIDDGDWRGTNDNLPLSYSSSLDLTNVRDLDCLSISTETTPRKHSQDYWGKVKSPEKRRQGGHTHYGYGDGTRSEDVEDL